MNQETQRDFSSLISAAVAERMNSDFVEQKVLACVDRLITESIEDALRSYSGTGKLVRKAVEESLKVNDLDLPSYGHVVSQILKTQIEAKVSELVAGRLAQDMNELLGLAPKEIKLSQIVKEAIEDRHDFGGLYGDVATCTVSDTAYGSTWVYFDPDKADQTKYTCKFKMLILDDGTMANLQINGTDTKQSKALGRFYGTEQKLRAYLACGTKIIIDEDAVVTSVGDY